MLRSVVLMPVTLRVCTSIVIISRWGDEEIIISPEQRYLPDREMRFFKLPRRLIRTIVFPYQCRFLFFPSPLLSFGTFALLSWRKQGMPWTSLKGGTQTAHVLITSVSELVWRTISSYQVSNFPLGKYNFWHIWCISTGQASAAVWRRRHSQGAKLPSTGHYEWNVSNGWENDCPLTCARRSRIFMFGTAILLLPCDWICLVSNCIRWCLGYSRSSFQVYTLYFYLPG